MEGILRRVNDFHPAIQSAIEYFSNSKISLQDIANDSGVTKQAIHKQILRAQQHFLLFDATPQPCQDCAHKTQTITTLQRLIAHLRGQLIIASAQAFLQNIFKEKVLKFYSKTRVTRLAAREKKQILDLYAKFKQTGRSIQDFCKAITRSPETLLRWEQCYKQHGLAGLVDKRTVPKNFGNKVPAWIKTQLIALFLRFPYWSEYQYHSHLKHNPNIGWYVCLPTIRKLKEIHKQRSHEEIERLLKRWCFAPGTSCWTIDYTCIIKTAVYKLQLLTISDTRSRYIFESALFLDTSTESMMKHLETLFLKHGKPIIIKADNGPEFRIDCRDQLLNLSIYLFNSPSYYGQFNGAHERMHRELKNYITEFEGHRNLAKLVSEIRSYEDQHNHDMTFDYLDGKTPAEVYLSGEQFVPKNTNTEIVTPYVKDDEFRMKFADRDGKPVRIDMPIIKPQDKII